MKKEFFEQLLLQKAYSELSPAELEEIAKWIGNEEEYETARKALQLIMAAEKTREKAPEFIFQKLQKQLPAKTTTYRPWYYAAAAVLVAVILSVLLLKNDGQPAPAPLVSTDSLPDEVIVQDTDTSSSAPQELPLVKKSPAPPPLPKVQAVSASLSDNKEVLELSVELF